MASDKVTTPNKISNELKDLLLSDTIDRYGAAIASEYKLTIDQDLELVAHIKLSLVGQKTLPQIESHIGTISSLTKERKASLYKDVEYMLTNDKIATIPQAPEPVKLEKKDGGKLNSSIPKNPFEARMQQAFSPKKMKSIFSKNDATDTPPKKPTTDPYRENK